MSLCARMTLCVRVCMCVCVCEGPVLMILLPTALVFFFTDEINPHFILHPRSLTVLRGESYSVECYYAQNRQTRTKVSFHDQRGIAGGDLFAYKYPNSTQPFPVYRVEEATIEGRECFFCLGQTEPYDPLAIRGSEKSIIDVQGEHSCVFCSIC